jgi:ABC-2 type transport system ATP-binding protein
VIEVRGLTKRYGARAAVDGLSFTVAPGTLYALLGGNGAGKTTTLNLILGLLAADGGEIRVDGQAVGLGARPRAVYVPEVVALYPDLDPLETLALFAAVAGRDVPEAERAGALARAGLAEEHHRRRVGTFSKGMRQKVALALAEVQGAHTVILDEPTSGLDPLASAQLAERLGAAKAAGAAILMSTHDVLHAAQLADRVGILQAGRLVAELDAAGMDAAALLAAYQAHVG